MSCKHQNISCQGWSLEKWGPGHTVSLADLPPIHIFLPDVRGLLSPRTDTPLSHSKFGLTVITVLTLSKQCLTVASSLPPYFHNLLTLCLILPETAFPEGTETQWESGLWG